MSKEIIEEEPGSGKYRLVGETAKAMDEVLYPFVGELVGGFVYYPDKTVIQIDLTNLTSAGYINLKLGGVNHGQVGVVQYNWEVGESQHALSDVTSLKLVEGVLNNAKDMRLGVNNGVIVFNRGASPAELETLKGRCSGWRRYISRCYGQTEEVVLFNIGGFLYLQSEEPVLNLAYLEERESGSYSVVVGTNYRRSNGGSGTVYSMYDIGGERSYMWGKFIQHNSYGSEGYFDLFLASTRNERRRFVLDRARRVRPEPISHFQYQFLYELLYNADPIIDEQ